MEVLEVGELARDALARNHGIALPLAGFTGAPYFSAAGEIVWVGASLPALHPRAVVTAAAPPRGTALRFESLPDQGWRRRLPSPDETEATRVIAAAGRLAGLLAATAGASGFGALLTRRNLAFPLDIAVAHVRDLAAGYAHNRADDVVTASRALLGLGPGLTPSGDDLAGAALFGRRFVAPRSADWATVASILSNEVKSLSHAVSAALFSDLARGESFAPLHAVAHALMEDDDDAALRAARTLIAIGHSSGWDMLTGFIIGTTGRLP